MKRMKQLYAWGCCLFVLLLTNCVEEYDARIDNTSPCLVVDGNILSDTTVVFTLTRSFGLNEEANDPANYQVNDATLHINGSDGSRWEARGIGEGEYSVTIGTLRPEEMYSVEIGWKGETYVSEPQQPLWSTAPEKLTFSKDASQHRMDINVSVVAGQQEEAEYYLWDYEEIWEVQSEYACRTVYEPELDEIVTYDQPPYDQGWIRREANVILVGSTEGFVGNQVKEKSVHHFHLWHHRLSVFYSILVSQRNISKAEYEYYQCRERLDYEMGGLFTPQPTELPTNIKCSTNPKNKVIGYVGCNMNITQKRLNIHPAEGEYEAYCGRLLSLDESQSKSPKDLFSDGYQICSYQYEPMNPAASLAYWGNVNCADVRAWGADTDESLRPSWWPIPIRVVTD